MATSGRNTKRPALMKGTRDRSYMIFIKSRGGHPIGEVFLIIKDTVRAAVMITTFLSKRSFT